MGYPNKLADANVYLDFGVFIEAEELERIAIEVHLSDVALFCCELCYRVLVLR